MFLRNWEVFNSISPLLKPHRVIVHEALSGCHGDCWARYEAYFDSVEEAQAYCLDFVEKEEKRMEIDSHCRYELSMEIIF